MLKQCYKITKLRKILYKKSSPIGTTGSLTKIEASVRSCQKNK